MTKAPKRPRDPNQLAKMMVDIATGEVAQEDVKPRGAPGGVRRAELLPTERRVEIARKAATTRWKGREVTPDEKA